MNTVKIYDKAGEPFEVSKARVISLLAQGWTLTKVEKPAAVVAKKEPETRGRLVKTYPDDVPAEGETEDK